MEVEVEVEVREEDDNDDEEDDGEVVDESGFGLGRSSKKRSADTESIRRGGR